VSAPTRAKPERRRSWRSLLIPAVLALAVLVGLGTWQIQRKAWKEQLIATLTERLQAPSVPLPAPATWPTLDQASNEYRRVTFEAEFETTKEALVFATASAFRPDVKGQGFWIFAPARLPDGSVVVVNRGFAPAAEAMTLPDRANPGIVAITGAIRWPEASHWFTPKPNPAENMWFVRDPVSIAAAKGWGAIAPFYVEQESPVPPGGWPQPGKLVPSLTDNHLQYAVTWFGLALVLALVFIVWAVKSGRETRRKRPGNAPSSSL
jgi:surfeit locus 1 family protein